MDPLLIIFLACLVIMIVSVIVLVGILMLDIIDFIRERVN